MVALDIVSEMRTLPFIALMAIETSLDSNVFCDGFGIKTNPAPTTEASREASLQKRRLLKIRDPKDSETQFPEP